MATEENPDTGHLSEADAMARLLQTPETDTEAEDAQAVQETEVEAEALEVEAEGEAEQVVEDEAPAEADTAEELDPEEAQKGYLRQADYTKKTQELAAERAALAAEKQQFQAQAQAQIESLRQKMEAFSIPTEQEPDWASLAAEKTPQEFIQAQVQWQETRKSQEQAAEMYRQMQTADQQRKLAQEAEMLRHAIPEWSDPKVQEADAKAIVSTATTLGFSEQEVQAITDHRLLVALRKLSRLTAAATAPKRAPAAPKRPVGQAPVPKEENTALASATSRFKKSGSKEDALAVLLARSGAN